MSQRTNCLPLLGTVRVTFSQAYSYDLKQITWGAYLKCNFLNPTADLLSCTGWESTFLTSTQRGSAAR